MELGLFVAEVLKDRKEVYFHVPHNNEYGEIYLDWEELMELGVQARGEVSHSDSNDSFIVWHNFEMPPAHDEAEGTIIMVEDDEGEGVVICQRINGQYVDIISSKVYDDYEIYRWAKLPVKLKVRL